MAPLTCSWLMRRAEPLNESKRDFGVARPATLQQTVIQVAMHTSQRTGWMSASAVDPVPFDSISTRV